MKVALLLANGFEEIEALTPLDMLRRAGVTAYTVGIGGEIITGSHGIKVIADTTDALTAPDDYDAVILPGGMPGATNLDASAFTDKILASVNKKGGLIAAICAAPLVLGRRGMLSGRSATCYPGFENELIGAISSDAAVVCDKNVITARGMGVALDFAKAIVTKLCGSDTAATISCAIMEKN
jgi:4-methyl-5(b-hydroxyethyl)-thiazole monophosphate biosynthesis